MGAVNTALNFLYLTLRGFKFQSTVSAKTETSLTVNVPDGEGKTKEIFVEEYNQINGKVVKMEVSQEESNDKKKQWKNLNIHIKDDSGETVIAQMYFDSDASFSFLKRLPNVNLLKDVSVCVRKNKQEGQEKAYARLDVYQINEKGESVLCEFKSNWKGEHSELPVWVKQKVNQKEVWDKSDMMNFFEGFINVKNAEIVDLNDAVQQNITAEEITRCTTDLDQYGKVYQPNLKSGK